MKHACSVYGKIALSVLLIIAFACASGAEEAKTTKKKSPARLADAKSATAKPAEAKSATAKPAEAKPAATLPAVKDVQIKTPPVTAAPAKAAKAAATPAKASGKSGSGKGKAKAKKEDEMPAVMPWNLRDHYTITFDKISVQYAIDTAEWRLETGTPELLLNSVGFKIVLGDGTTLKASDLGKGDAPAARQTTTNDIGKNTVYKVLFPARNGLVVEHSFEVYADRPFILVHVAVGNTSDKPVELAKILPVVVEPGAMAPLAAGSVVSTNKLRFVGASPVFDGSAPSALSIFHIPSQNFVISFGSLPHATAVPSANFVQNGNAWSGDVTCAFTPAIRLDPGQKIDASAWMTLTVPDPADLHTYYGWVASKAPHQTTENDRPAAWVTVEDGKGEDDLITAIGEWKNAKVDYALVPAAWEGRPGSLEGGAPGFSKDIGKTAKRIKDAGAKAGLTVDPLRIVGGQGDWSASSTDGQQWLNLANPAARQFCIEHLKKVTDQGYDFIVVSASSIPDEVLKHFNQTRAMAQTLALAAAVESAQGKPVYPAAAAQALKADEAAWLEAGQATGRMGYYGILVAPIRFSVTELGGVDEKVAKAMGKFSGPIELVGKPKSEVVRALAPVVSQNATRGIQNETAAATPAQAETADTTKTAKKDK